MELHRQERLSGTDRVKDVLADPAAFLQEAFRRDQTFTDDDNAANIALLTRPEVARFFEAHPEHQFEYQNLLSLSYFHRGKSEALRQQNGEAAASFTLAVRHARAAEAHADEGYRPWTRYVEATLAYFESDLSTLKEVTGELEEGPNKEILRKLVRSLETDGRVDYAIGYA